jgi:hypothetical protein
MKPTDYAFFLEMAKKHENDGTIQHFVLNTNPNSNFESVLKEMVDRLLADKRGTIQENQKMSSILKKHGLYYLILEEDI